MDAFAFVAACAIHLAATALFVPHALRHESAAETAMRFASKGPTHYDEIRVVIIPYGDPGASPPRRLLGDVQPQSDATFQGKVEETSQASRTKDRGQAGESEAPSTGIDAFERLRLLHGNLPTAQTEDVATREVIKPDYPEEARTKGIEGTVVLVALVNEEGRVEDVALENSVDPLLDQAAMRAAYRTPFFPYRIEGVAQAVFVRMPYHFELVGRLGN